MERVLDRARIGPNDVILEVGTGTGPLALGALERIGPEGSVIALDVSVDFLEELWRAYPGPGLSLLVGDAEVVPLPDASVDVVLGRSALSSAHEKAETALELHRVLRAGGRVSLFEPGDTEDVTAWFADAGFAAIDTEPGLFLAGTKT